MLRVKSCNVKHNSESVFRYFASAPNGNQKIFMLSVVIEAFEKSVMFLCTTQFANRCLVAIQRLGFISPCIAHQPD